MTDEHPSIYKRIYEVRIKEAKLLEDIKHVQPQIRLDRLGIYCREGLITPNEATVSLVKRMMDRIPEEFFQAYAVEWGCEATFQGRLKLAMEWTRGDNSGTPMEEIDGLRREQEKPKHPMPAWARKESE